MVRTWPGLLLGTLALAVCAPRGPNSPNRPNRPNIVLYVIDTLRADRLSLYGYEHETSPNIDSLAASGVVFEQAVAPAPWTLPSVTSLMLSQLPCEHGVLIDRDRISDSSVPLAETLKELGYRTASFHANPYAGKMTGLDRGYDESRLVRQAHIEGRVRAWLDSLDDDTPFFLYVHTVEPHNPELAEGAGVPDSTRDDVERFYRDYRTLTRFDWDANQPLGTTDNTEEQVEALGRLRGIRGAVDILYDASVRDADARVGRLKRKLDELGLWDDTLFVLVSDHGEELGDRGGWQHDHSVYDELTRVPFIVRFPDDEGGGRRERSPVGLIDVAPTILDYLGVEPSADVRGRSLLESVPNELRFLSMRENHKKYFRPNKELRGDVNLVVRRGPWKGIWNVEGDHVELYQLAADPLEQQILSHEESEIAAAIRDYAEAALSALPRRGSRGRAPHRDRPGRGNPAPARSAGLR